MVYDKQVSEAGIFVSGESLADLTTATAVRVGPDGQRTVTDGPFAESREVLGGFYVIDVPNLDVALDWAARCPGARGGGSVVVRPIADFGE
ncbi:YCII-related domain protein [Rhodococcus sp. MTM3W5.2]|nr:YCII-related domain protein [Rhodococcus sp. MTM3W5.2]